MEKAIRTTVCYTLPGLIRARAFECPRLKGAGLPAFVLVHKERSRRRTCATGGIASFAFSTARHFHRFIERFLLLANFAARTSVHARDVVGGPASSSRPRCRPAVCPSLPRDGSCQNRTGAFVTAHHDLQQIFGSRQRQFAHSEIVDDHQRHNGTVGHKLLASTLGHCVG